MNAKLIAACIAGCVLCFGIGCLSAVGLDKKTADYMKTESYKQQKFEWLKQQEVR